MQKEPMTGEKWLEFVLFELWSCCFYEKCTVREELLQNAVKMG